VAARKLSTERREADVSDIQARHYFVWRWSNSSIESQETCTDMVHPKQKAELWERWKSGQWVADVARALEDRKRCLRSWLSMEELLQRHTGELRRAVLQ
jgi:hypothetical protein